MQRGRESILLNLLARSAERFLPFSEPAKEGWGGSGPRPNVYGEAGPSPPFDIQGVGGPPPASPFSNEGLPVDLWGTRCPRKHNKHSKYSLLGQIDTYNGENYSRLVVQL